MKMGRTVKNVQTGSSKRKKRVKWILIIIGLIIGFGLLWFMTAYWLDPYISYRYYHSDTSLIMAWISSILFALSAEILIVYLIFLRLTRKIGGKDKTKKYLKISLVVILPFLLLSAFAFFTKVGKIPNRLDIELLCPEEDDFYRRRDYGCYDDPSFPGGVACLDKPIIYLYPTTEVQVNVRLGTPENLSHTYPKYNSEKGWNVVAQPNGDLEDTDTGRKLYALYWEGKSERETNFDEGFVVEGKDIIPFLEEKLAILGLNEREAEEFIVYWLPQMENNKYNLIRFETIEEQNKNMPLKITPTPDTVIRVMMDWKTIDEPINIPEQELTTPERSGFTVIEWGGSPRN